MCVPVPPVVRSPPKKFRKLRSTGNPLVYQVSGCDPCPRWKRRNDDLQASSLVALAFGVVGVVVLVGVVAAIVALTTRERESDGPGESS